MLLIWSYVLKIVKIYQLRPTSRYEMFFWIYRKHFCWHKGLLYKLKNNGINENVLQLIESFLHNRRQRVVLNGQSSSWLSIRAVYHKKGQYWDHCFFSFIQTTRRTADDSSLFSIVNCVNTLALTLNSDLLKYRAGHTNGKCHLIQIELSKHKKLFSPERKMQPQIHHFFFRSSEIKFSSNQKHLGLTLDSKLSFNEYINDKIHQGNKGVSLPRKLETILPQRAFNIYKSFIRPLLDYADVIYDQPCNASFSKKLNQFNIMRR